MHFTSATYQQKQIQVRSCCLGGWINDWEVINEKPSKDERKSDYC